MTLFDRFRDGGWGMYPTVLLGLLLLGVAVKYAVSPERRFVPLLVALNVATLVSGALGFVSGVIVTANALSSEGITQPTNISFFGVGEALNNVAFALLLIMVATMATTVGAWKLTRDGVREAA
ncbi:MAG: hypothetical protein ACLQVI_02740 [Polyangiaceae bacterium]|jgi:hypothetical protein